MADPDTYTPPGGPPQGISPSRELCAAMGEANIFRMCEGFYAELETSAVRHMFPQDMKEASKKIAAFLVGLFGGPPLFQELYGAPQMRARHLGFAIDEAARQTWLNCFKKTLEHPDKYNFPSEYLPGFIRFIDEFSAWMVNRKPA
ncbi:MAG: hypothetical protein KJ626_06185 [Verrucomicrobia bacterium]|nr:hypothetical protein [Verrucomicrobiota bacterium]